MTDTLVNLADRLRASAGETPERAAIGVLTVHGAWLQHPGFILACVRTFRDRWWIDWRVVRRFITRTPCSPVDQDVLFLAVELAQWRTGRRLRESSVLRNMDPEINHGLWQAVGSDLAYRSPERRRRR